jgi:acyl-CoA thioesterase I
MKTMMRLWSQCRMSIRRLVHTPRHTRVSCRSGIASGLLLIALLALAACGGTSGGASTAGQPSATASGATPTASTAGAPGVRYVALGASDAVGVGASDPNHTAYVPIIISRLPKGSAALNLGIDGEKLHGALTDELPHAIAAKPTLITVWLVGNDFKQCVPLQQYGADLDTLLTQLQRQTTAHVFVANAPDFSALPAVQAQAASGSFCGAPGSQASIRSLAQQWNQVINASVAAHHDTLVDLFNSDLASNPGYVASDGFHPSDQGYLALANLFWSAITAQGAAQAA